MDLFYLVKGLMMGFAIAAPVGPIGILCIQWSLRQGRLYGIVSGLGAATADAIYGLIAGLGLTFISHFLIQQEFWFQMIGGSFLCYLGVRTLRSKPAKNSVTPQGEGLLKVYTLTLFLTLTNPMTILSFMGIFSGLGISNGPGNSMSPVLFILGVFIGSSLWWLLLSMSVDFFREKLNLKWMIWIHRLSGLIILGFGTIAIYDSLHGVGSNPFLR